MKILMLSFFVVIIGASFIRLDTAQPTATDARAQLDAYRKKFAVNCSPDFSSFHLEDSANVIPLLSGWGNYRMPVTTSNDSARIYFEQGINMYYGFHIIEALASFEKSTRFDPRFAMGYWGKALAYGPNINDNGYTASPAALVAMQQAKALYSHCTPVEQGLIDAIQVRYSADTTQTREALNQLYANAMKKLHQQFSNNADVATLYADALMVQHPWDLYTKAYQPKAWTPEIVNTLEGVLKIHPQHPGASHYYIHAVEASTHPERGLAVARQLPQLMPGVSHIVHMPSHIFIRSGYYNEGEQVNDRAVKSYYAYVGKYAPVTGSSPLYLIHNLHMQATCANMDGRFTTAMKASMDCKNSFDSSWQGLPGYDGIFMQYLYMTPYLTLIRFGKWDALLNSPENPSGHVYANLLWHYGRGLAFARKHDLEKANKELEALRKDLANSQLKAPAPSYANPGIAGASIAEKILQGVIAEEDNNLTAAATWLQQAVTLEDSMIYNEPKDWVHPVRQYLGNTLLKAKRYKEAQQAFEQDLIINPNNGWSLVGLTEALARQGQKKATIVKHQAAKALSESDVDIRNAVF